MAVIKSNEFLKERYDFFVDNVFPKIYSIVLALSEAPKFRFNVVKGGYFSEKNFTMNGMKITYDFYAIKNGDEKIIDWCNIEISYKFRKVLSFAYLRGEIQSFDKFHECEWISKLDSIPEKILEKEKELVARDFKKLCKDYEKKCK